MLHWIIQIEHALFDILPRFVGALRVLCNLRFDPKPGIVDLCVDNFANALGRVVMQQDLAALFEIF